MIAPTTDDADAIDGLAIARKIADLGSERGDVDKAQEDIANGIRRYLLNVAWRGHLTELAIDDR